MEEKRKVVPRPPRTLLWIAIALAVVVLLFQVYLFTMQMSAADVQATAEARIQATMEARYVPERLVFNEEKDSISVKRDWETGIHSALSLDGRYYAVSVSLDDEIVVYDTETEKRVLKFDVADNVWDLEWSKENLLAVSGSKSSVTVQDIKTNETVFHTDAQQGYGINYDADWSPNSAYLAVVGSKGLTIWETENWTIIRTLEGYYTSAAWTSDSQQLFISDDNQVLLVSLGDSKKQVDNDWLRASEEITYMAVAPDDSKIAIGGETGGFFIYNLDDATLLQELQGFSSEVNTMQWSDDSRFVLIASEDAGVRIWDAEQDRLRYILIQEYDNVDEAFWSPDYQYIWMNPLYITVWPNPLKDEMVKDR